MRALIVILTTVVISTAMHAQVASDAEKACGSVSHLKVPSVQPISESDRKLLASCDPAGLYYGVRGKPDYTAARRCALYKLQTSKARPDVEGDIFPTATAAMIYENGLGVPRDADLALHLFCSFDQAHPQFASADVLLAARSKADPNGFDFCVLDTDKINAAICASTQYKREDNQRPAELRSLMVNWVPAQVSAYAAVSKAHDAYVGAATNEAVEACITGTLDEEMEYDDQLAKEFESDVTRLVRGDLPHFSHADFVAADRALNTAYRSKMSALEAKTGGCAKDPGSLRTGERAWIRYREAWLKFALVRWLQVPADSWLTFLTRERTTHVNSVPVE